MIAKSCPGPSTLQPDDHPRRRRSVANLGRVQTSVQRSSRGWLCGAADSTSRSVFELGHLGHASAVLPDIKVGAFGDKRSVHGQLYQCQYSRATFQVPIYTVRSGKGDRVFVGDIEVESNVYVPDPVSGPIEDGSEHDGGTDVESWALEA